MIPVAGVEPALQRNTILSRARLPIPPHRHFLLEAATGIEPVVKVLQTSALPLGYAANVFGAKDGIRTRDPNLGKVVFYH
jgi:hypothetical protein